MENAVQALKIGAAILVFSIALASTFLVFAQAKQVSEVVFFTADNDSYMEYSEGNLNENFRIVGVDTIIPMVCSYYKGEYTITIKDSLGNKIVYLNSSVADEDTGLFLDRPGMLAKIKKVVNETLLKSPYKDKKYRETFYQYDYKGSTYTDPITGETIKDINTRTMVDITYQIVE